MFIYKITNIQNGKIYVGQTIQKPSLRFSRHKCNLNGNKHANKHLQYSWNKYGKNSFQFEVIDTAAFIFNIDNLERFWIKHYDSMNPNKGYNKESGGNRNKIKSASSIEKQKLSILKYWTPERKREMSEKKKGCHGPNKGRVFGKEFSDKMSLLKSRTHVTATNINNGNTFFFQTVKEAAQSTNSSTSGVRLVCKGKRNSCNGWIFSFVEKVRG